MNRTVLILIFLSFLSNSCTWSGTLGGFDSRVFPASEKKLVIAFEQLYKDHPEYIIPNKWKHFDNWSERGFDFLDSYILYLEKQPEEMYYISFIGDSAMLADTSKAILAIRAVRNNKSKRWLLVEDFGKKERERIEHRFDKEIIEKLQGYTKLKAKREN